MNSRVVIKTHLIENSTGQYKAWAEKRFCRSEYRFYAKQISVKANGEHLHIDCMLDTFRFARYEPVSVVELGSVSEYEMRLNEFGGAYVGRITELKRRFGYFCADVNRMAKNDIRKVS